ncbi:MAG TPA: 4a-hydroxytetrahydrobiopterin dehydratase [Opitutaceae bacterium]|jgi:4a-hydroxytetrahydrobiopterin dehydratase|nr:4a-hydroxytetrahydrobiopterin dehydratase [Opitutaceae bacterium]
MPLLTSAEIKQRMPSVPGWKRSGKSIHREFTFKGFMGSIGFVRKVAAVAEAKDHHPDIDIRWNRVRLVLSTHSEGGLTTKDFALARLCSAGAKRIRG